MRPSAIGDVFWRCSTKRYRKAITETSGGSPHAERGPAGELRLPSEFLFDSEKTVILCDALASASRTGFDLAGASRDRKIRDRRVLSLAGAMRYHAGILSIAGNPDRFKRFCQSADLIQFDQNRIRDALLDRPADDVGIGHKDVIANELDTFAKFTRQEAPAEPIVLGKPVFE
jgi:hypothetical protein